MASDIYGDSEGMQLRYNPILIWIKADTSVLEQRIKRRVDKMIDKEDGLEEIRHVFDKFTS